MVKKQKSKLGECVYCRKTTSLTVDHIPPKNLFAPPRPSNLITVPSCLPCNNQASQDDRYFQVALALNDELGDHPDIAGISPKVVRGLNRPQEVRSKLNLLRRTKIVSRSTPSGFYYPTPLYTVDVERLERVIERLAKGLFYYERKIILPVGYEAHGFTSILARCEASFRQELEQNFFATIIRSEPGKTIGNNVFTYWKQFFALDENVSAWVFLFYGKVMFYCVTLAETFDESELEPG